jgi:hypothetical protein
MTDLVRWSAGIDEVIKGDITAAAAYITPAGGAVVTAVAPCGITRRDQGMVGFTTSLGFGKKLERIVADPRVALAYHAREHGFSASSAYVLAQGLASVDLTPSRERLEELTPQVERYVGKVVRGPVWDRLLREYYQERVLVEIGVTRMATWPDLGAAGEVEVTGASWPPGWPAPQQPPKNGTGPRVDVAKATERVAILPHHVLAYQGADGFPVIVPVHVAGYDAQGMRLVVPAGLLPPGGRRAGLLAHSYRAHLVGLTSRVFTGWLEVSDNGAVYAPHTSKGFVAPPMKRMLLVSNGLLAKYGLWQARRQGLAERLDRLAHTPSAPASPGTAAPPG